LRRWAPIRSATPVRATTAARWSTSRERRQFVRRRRLRRGCAQAQLPGVYTSVANPLVHDFHHGLHDRPVPALLGPAVGAITPWLSGVLKEVRH